MYVEYSSYADWIWFQWLPCEVDISREHAKRVHPAELDRTRTTRMTSYINNLHPHKEMRLYELIEKLIDASIPLWNASLAPLADGVFIRQPRIAYTVVKYHPDPKSWPKSKHVQKRPGNAETSGSKKPDVLVLSFPSPITLNLCPSPLLLI